MRTFRLVRLFAAVVMALGLSMAAGSPSAAQDDEENGRTAAQVVRELVLKQRERVLAHVAAIMAGDEEDTESTEIDVAEAAEGEDEADDGEGEDEGEGGEDEDEGEDGEGEDGEGEDGEGEDEGEDEGVGGEGEACEPQGGEAIDGGAEGDAAAGDEAETDEAEDGGTDDGEADDSESAGSEADTPGDQEVCILPSTGTGAIGDTHSMLAAFAALAAVAAAGFSLRQRSI